MKKYDPIAFARWQRDRYSAQLRRFWHKRSSPWHRREIKALASLVRYWTGRIEPRIDVTV